MEYEQRKSTLYNPLTNWVYSYKNMREIINPYFLKNCPPNISKNVIVRRLEYIIQEECKANLGASFMDDTNYLGVYNYLYNYSKNRPKDEELVFENHNHKL